MPENIFTLNPVEAALQGRPKSRSIMGGTNDPNAAAAQIKPIEVISGESQVPLNVLEAFSEVLSQSGAVQYPAQIEQVSREFANQVGSRLKAGADVPTAMKELLADDAQLVIDRALQIAKGRAAPQTGQPAPAQKPNDGAMLKDMGRQIVGGVAKATGATVEGLGMLFDPRNFEAEIVMGEDGIPRPKVIEPDGPSDMVRNTRKAADGLRKYGESVQKGVSAEGRAAIKDSTPDGDLFKPSTWTLGKNPSLRGYVLLAGDVLGSLALVVAASIATGPPGGAVIGGAQSGGAGADQARQVVRDAAQEVDANGVSRLERESAYYRELIAAGETPESALEKTEEAAGQMGALFSAPIGAFGGAATGAIVTRGVKELAGKGIATRVAGTAAISAAEEAVQETAEGVAARAGAQVATGMDVDLTEGTFGDAVLGALAGGPIGAVAGLRRETDDQEPQAPEVLALPAPDAPPAPPAPPAIDEVGHILSAISEFAKQTQGAALPANSPAATQMVELERTAMRLGATEEEIDAAFSGRYVPPAPVAPVTPEEMIDPETGEVLDAPVSVIPATPPAQPGEPLPPVDALAPPPADVAPPAGPLSRAAQQAPEISAAPRMPTGTQVRVETPDGVSIEAELVEETPQGVMLKGPTGPLMVTREQLDSGQISVKPRDPIEEQRQAMVDAEVEANFVEVDPLDVRDGYVVPSPDFDISTPTERTDMILSALRRTENEIQTSLTTRERQIAFDLLDRNGGNVEDVVISILEKEPEFDADATEAQNTEIPFDEPGTPQPDRQPDPELGQERPVRPESNAGDEAGSAAPQPDGGLAGQPQEPAGREVSPEALSVEDVPDRPKLAVVRGVPKDNEAAFEGLPYIVKWNDNVGGWTFSKKHADKVLDHLRSAPAPATPATPATAPAPVAPPAADRAAPQLQDGWPNTIIKLRHAAKQVGLTKEDVGEAWTDKVALYSAVSARLREMGMDAEAEARPRPDIGSPEYSLQDARADLRDMQDQQDANGMIGDSRLESRIERQKSMIVRMEKEVSEKTEKTPTPKEASDWWKGLSQDQRTTALGEAGYLGMVWDDLATDERMEVFSRANSVALQSRSLKELRDSRSEGAPETDKQKAIRLFKEAVARGDEGEISKMRDLLTRMLGAPATASIEADAAPTAPVAQAAAEADPAPTEAQKEAGNYKKGHARWNGLDLSIENEQGSTRSGTSQSGKAWSVTMPAHYGYFRQTKGADGDHVDFYMGETQDSDFVAVVDQIDPDTGQFDEIKVILGSRNVLEAFKIYTEGFSDGKGEDRAGAITLSDTTTLKKFLAKDDHTGPFSGAEGNARTVKSPTLRGLAELDGSLPQSELPSLSQLRGAGDNGASVSDQLPELSQGGRGAPDTKAPTGPGSKRQGLRTGKPSLADQEAERTQYAQEPDGDGAGQNSDDSGVGGNVQSGPVNDLVSTGQGDGPGKSGDDASKVQWTKIAATGLLSGLSQEKQDRAAELKRRLADKVRNQTSSGLDPEYITLGGELVGLYIEAGSKRFAQMLRDFAESTGLSMREAQAPMRAAYNFVREEMELAGQDITDMDSADAVMAEVRRAIADASSNPTIANSGDEAQNAPTAAQDGDGPNEQDADRTSDDGSLEGSEPRSNEGVGPQGSVAAGEGAGQSGRGGNAGGNVRGDQPRAGGSDGAADVPDAPASTGQLSGPNPGNFTIGADFDLGGGTDKQKIDANMEAIRIIKALDAEQRYPTRAEQKALARYVGWGGLRRVFDPKSTGKSDMWGRTQAELKEILTPEEYDAARQSTRNAHYTARPVVEAMWKAMAHFGFSGGRALEPTVGSGNFLGLQPSDMAGQTEWFAAELDPLTGRIAKNLYPDAKVLDGTGFEKANFGQGVFDIAIGNPPFGSNRVNDPLRAHLDGTKVHNYIINKTGEHLRPGGVMAMVITHRFLDTQDSEGRGPLADNFKMLGAIRLPNDAFAENAGTEVVTDIVFFQKLHADEKPDRNAAWLDTQGQIEGEAGPIRVNRYFQENPHHILGRSAMDGTMYARGAGTNEYTVHGDGRDLSAAINEIITQEWAGLEGALGGRTQTLNEVADVQSESRLAIGEMMLDPSGDIIRRGFDGPDGTVTIEKLTPESPWSDGAEEWVETADLLAEIRKEYRQTQEVSPEKVAALKEAASIAYLASGEKKAKPTKGEQAIYDALDGVEAQSFGRKFVDALTEIKKSADRRRLGQGKYDRLKGMLALRADAIKLVQAERTDAPDMERLRKKLARDHAAFVKKFGYVNDRPNQSIMGDDLGLEIGLEQDYKEADPETKTPSSAKPAAILSERVNFPVREITSASDAKSGLTISLTERGGVDLGYIANLTKQSVDDVVADLTSGENPSIFLDPETESYVDAESYLSGNVKAKLARAEQEGMEANIKALRAAQPAPLPQERIVPAIRSQWIPAQIFKDFLADLGVSRAEVSIYREAGMVSVDGREASLSEFGTQFQHQSTGVVNMMRSAMTGKPITITEPGVEPNSRVKDEVATREVNALVKRMGETFRDWAYADADRAQRIVDAYNENMNTHVERKFDGEKYLKPVGASAKISLLRTQKNAAWRMIQSRSVLLDHVVGAGKTFTVITGVMERRRLGLSRKPVVAVPNHLVGQWAREWYQLYPGAKLLAASPSDFTKKNRRKLLARIATGEYDAIILGHSSLGFIENDPDIERRIIDEQVRELRDTADRARTEGTRGATLTQIANKIESYETRLKRLATRPQDNIGANFSEMGIDHLTVDEAHEFKNLEYSTSGERLVGMNNPQGSKRAFDLYIKVRSALGKDGGAVAFATGTPVSNSLVEIYAMLKYLALDDLKSRNQHSFDAWSAAFVEAETRFEYNATQKLVERRVMSGLVNLDGLTQLYRSVADVIDMDDLKRIYEQDTGKRFPTPKVKTGARVLMTAPPTPKQVEFTDYLVARMGGIKDNASNKDYMSIDNALWVLSDARKASLDIRTINPTLPRDPQSKVARSAREIKRIYDKWHADKGAQLVFSDLSTPSKSSQKDARRLITAARAAITSEREAKAQVSADIEKGVSFEDQWKQAVEGIVTFLESDAPTDRQRDALVEKMAAFEAEGPGGIMLTADTGFSVYDDLRAALVESGIPEQEIEFIHDFNTLEQKAKLFQRVNDGDVRVLLGSTPKMGAGTNVQKRLVALHHLDSPWRPSDVEQREGRIIRQRNSLYERDPDGFEVEILAYSTEGTSDVVLWQILERKSRSIGKFRQGGLDTMDEGSSDADSYADFMAASTGNPVFKQKMEAERLVTDLRAEISGALLAKSQGQQFLARYERESAETQAAIDAAESIEIGDIVYKNETGSLAGLKKALADAQAKYEADMAAYAEKEEAIKKERKALFEKGVPQKDWPNMPTRPARPSIGSKEVREASDYARIVRTILDDAKSTYQGQTLSYRIGSLPMKLTNRGEALGGMRRFDVSADLPGVGAWYGDVASAVVKNLDQSRDILAGFRPDSLEFWRENLSAGATKRLTRLKSQKGDAEKAAARVVDQSKLSRAKDDLGYYTAAVALAEAQADLARAGRPNEFIDADTTRDLSGASKEGAVGMANPVALEFEGEQFSLYGGPVVKAPPSVTPQRFGESYFLTEGRSHAHDEDVLIVFRQDEKTKEEIAVNYLRAPQEPPQTPEGLKASKRTAPGERRTVAQLNGAELGEGLSLPDLRKAAFEWYRDNLVGKTVRNAEAGFEVTFSRRGASKSVFAKGDKIARIIPALVEVIQNGTVISTEPGKDTRSGVKAVHRIGARVMLMGQPKDVVVIVREMQNGTYHYDLARDMSDGARFRQATAGISDAQRPGPELEVSPVAFNLEIRDFAVNDIGADEAKRRLRVVARDVQREIGRTTGMKVKVTLQEQAFDFGKGYENLDGYFLDGVIGVSLSSSVGAVGIARHEVIHALRNPALFGGTHGAFTRGEWLTLVRAARKNSRLRAEVDQSYPNLDDAGRIEEVIAEMYREWSDGRDTGLDDAGRSVMEKIRDILDAIINALRGNGMQTAAAVFERVRSGEMGGRGLDGAGPGSGGIKARKRSDPADKAKGETARQRFLSNILTQAMAGTSDSSRVNSLALVPGRPLLMELGKEMPATRTYLRLKEKMDSLRNQRHADIDRVAQDWRRLISGDKIWKRGDKPTNAKMMDLMHDSTIAGVDPSLPFQPVSEPRDKDIVRLYKKDTETYKEAKKRLDQDVERLAAYDGLRERYTALPKPFRDMFVTVRNEYRKLADEFERAIEEQAGKAMTVAVRRAERAHAAEMERIRDEGLEGNDLDRAVMAADERLATARTMTLLSKQARIAQLRNRFERNRVEGPYFPLSRFGDLYVTSRDDSGKVVSFSRFERVADQQAEAEAMKAEGFSVEVGVMAEPSARDMVDPGFVADIEGLLEEINADTPIMDAIWQRWLETLPDMSIRKNRIHRKGTPGYSGDAFRAFGRQMFHGAHQLARLKYSLDMKEALEVAQQEAKSTADPVRNGLVVREMSKRHDYVMNPQGSAWSQAATSAAFVYYLGATPAAALVNISQTTVVGIPILAAAYGKGGIRKASVEIMRALGDFTAGFGHAANSNRLTAEEKAAMEQAYDRGIVDKSQSHDLAGVGEAGVEYSAIRTMIMKKISFFFHHAERMNREVTFLAAYRMAKAQGADPEQAIQKAGDLTWKTHFDYQNTSRPRLMQNDTMRVLLVFKNFQTNLLWRLFRDMHQTFAGESKEARREAGMQLAGITGSMFLHAGIKGVWGYSLLMGLLGLFFPGGSDDAEEVLEGALLNYMPKAAAGVILNGAPGHALGVNLTSRIGMPDLWFRSSNRELEGEDEYNYWLQEVLGAVPGIAENIWRGADMIMDGEYWRGIETASPKFVRDIMRSGRYVVEGAETMRGDPILEEMRWNEELAQAMGFTPARLSERYDLNSRMKNRETRIMNERKKILADARKAQRKGKGMPSDVIEAIADFNRKHPDYPITGQTLKRSIQSGIRSSMRNVQGVQINPRLERSIRGSTRDPIYE